LGTEFPFAPGPFVCGARVAEPPIAHPVSTPINNTALNALIKKFLFMDPPFMATEHGAMDAF
jgi:hypothetical protein